MNHSNVCTVQSSMSCLVSAWLFVELRHSIFLPVFLSLCTQPPPSISSPPCRSPHSLIALGDSIITYTAHSRPLLKQGLHIQLQFWICFVRGVTPP